MALLVLGIVIFLGIHLVRSVAPAIRIAVIKQRGIGTWHAIHAILALVGLALITIGFAQARTTTGMLYTPPVFMAHAALTLMLVACICLVAAFLPPGKIRVATRHPAILAVKIWALAHLLANGETASVLLFGSFLAWGVIMRVSMKRRWRAGEIAYPRFVSYSYDLAAAVIGAALFGVIVWKLHELVIGVAPLVVA
ncbi:NnrU family protein, required for expression of nitric oxide and nitrite reductases (Nir and Nor) [Sinorhizobium sojae CCBAU 05684]|uniref:NnrU family protein, required for expression of nitric oxide and nitrite reductases (Nir and Nor) n=1 Tax=Sinorhizobium sojae CCBAU 05684 TaxID=716928 RepID=A0A249PDA8_9HYPH|nr:NnrU family protein [Sinorhizobium sojae]ASY63898.1 NnrU family protein, required for expression of nitric oxide and nitrite reductases (Nir and Nor) [Sinorhizobium sojae CCBAU 05684]